MAHRQLLVSPRAKGYRSGLPLIQSCGTRVFGDEINPAPHAKCIVGITAKRRRYSRIEVAILIEASNTKRRYIAAGVKRIGAINPAINESEKPTSANGGAR
jgi:hypothetical protein